MTGFPSVAAATISGAFVFGMILVLLESGRELLVKRLNMSDGQADWLLSAFNLSLIPMMLLSGVLADRFDVKSVLVGGSLMTCAAVFALAMSRTVLHAFGSVLAIGIGGACLSMGSTVLMRSAFFPNNEAASQNLGNVFFALGALLTPTVAHQLTNRLGHRRAFILLAAVCLLPALTGALTTRQAFELPNTGQADLGRVFSHPLLWLAALVFFLYGPLEGTLGTWATRYLSELGYSTRRAAWVLAGFWLSFLLGRLGAAFLERDLARSSAAQSWVMVLLALAAGVCLGNLSGARKGFTPALGLFLIGACLGPIFPTLVGVLFADLRPERGTAYGAMFALGATGNFVLLPLIGAYTRRQNVQRALRVPMITALLLALAAFVFALYPLIRES